MSKSIRIDIVQSPISGLHNVFYEIDASGTKISKWKDNLTTEAAKEILRDIEKHYFTSQKREEYSLHGNAD